LIYYWFLSQWNKEDIKKLKQTLLDILRPKYSWEIFCLVAVSYSYHFIYQRNFNYFLSVFFIECSLVIKNDSFSKMNIKEIIFKQTEATVIESTIKFSRKGHTEVMNIKVRFQK